MNPRTLATTTLLLASLSLAGCQTTGQGPTTWLDRPLDGQHFPQAALTIQAHASDDNGVSKVQFFVAGALLAEAPGGGQRLSNAQVDWMPPGPGTYVLSARAIDSQGNYGPSAQARIVVGGAAATSTPTPYSKPATAVPPKPATAQIVTAPPAEAGGPSVSLIQNANCRVGPGTVFDNIDTLMKGTSAGVEGRNEQNTWLMVRRPGGRGTCWVSTVSVIVQGDLNEAAVVAVAPPAAPPVAPPPGGVVVPPAQPQDTTPPSISDVSIEPTSIQKAGCGAPDTFYIGATVTDASGVGNVIYEMHGPGGQGGEWYLQPAGGNQYQATGGPISGDTGSWSINIRATDMAQNTAQAGPWTIQVACIQ